jgi:hypothetical protein
MRQERFDPYFFLVEDCFSSTACFFFWSALFVLDCFCVDFFWFDFGDLSPIVLLFVFVLTSLWHESFLPRRKDCNGLDGRCKAMPPAQGFFDCAECLHSFPRDLFTTKSLARRSRNQSLITLDSRRGAEDGEKTFLLFRCSAISASLRENLAAGKCCQKNKTFQERITKLDQPAKRAAVLASCQHRLNYAPDRVKAAFRW